MNKHITLGTQNATAGQAVSVPIQGRGIWIHDVTIGPAYVSGVTSIAIDDHTITITGTPLHLNAIRDAINEGLGDEQLGGRAWWYLLRIQELLAGGCHDNPL